MSHPEEGHDPGAHDAEAGHGTHAAGHGADEADEPLGPIDVVAWAYTLAGAALGVVTVLTLYVASTA
jgi:hypothetical protein